jgi:hypothetical protein
MFVKCLSWVPGVGGWKGSDLVDIFSEIWREANAPKVTKIEAFHSYALNTLGR